MALAVREFSEITLNAEKMPLGGSLLRSRSLRMGTDESLSSNKNLNRRVLELPRTGISTVSWCRMGSLGTTRSIHQIQI